MKRWWKVLVPAVATIGVLGAVVPTAVAGQLDNDSRNNRLQVRMTLTCNPDRSVTLAWRSINPRGADTVAAKWYNATNDPELRSPTPAREAEQVAAVRRNDRTAYGSFTIHGARRGDLIAIFVDAWAGVGDERRDVGGLGRNLDHVPWVVATHNGVVLSPCAPRRVPLPTPSPPPAR